MMVSLPSGRTATSLSLGYAHTCALLDNASIYCWGETFYGQLGDGSNMGILNGVGSGLSTPVSVNFPAGRTAVGVYGTGSLIHTCAILDDGSVYCWGANNYGQLGDGTTTNRSTPVALRWR